MSSIVVEGLTKTYGDVRAVDDVTFAIEPGEVFVLLGPNGAGKTTTIEILEGLRTKDDGTATVLGADAGAPELRPRIGVMPQHSDLASGMRTNEALRLFAAFYDNPEDPDELMQRLDLTRVARTSYRRLSGGERRRVSLALALVGRPEVAFLDEPTAEMDIEGRITTWELVGELRERGTTVVLTTHLLDEAEKVADRVGILKNGKLVALGPPAQLTGRGTGTVTFTTDAAPDLDALSAALGTPVSESGRLSYRIDNETATPDLVGRLAAWMSARRILLVRLDVGPRSLEDVYLELTR